jgi:hypothetical protein
VHTDNAGIVVGTPCRDRPPSAIGVTDPCPDTTADVPAPAPLWKDPIVLVAAALVLVPTVAAMVSALRTPWVPTNDWALIELQVRAVGTSDTPLLGAWSRFGWDHPGPWLFYLLALPYRLVPSEHGLLFASAALNFASVAGCAALALRRTRAQALVLLVGLAVLQRGLGIVGLLDPWNPTQPILPFALYCLACLELAVAVAPRRWMLALAAATGSFAVQAHVGFTQPVLLVGLAAGALALTRHGRGWRRLRSIARSGVRWRAVLPTAVVLAVAWLPVAIDQLWGSGNAGTMLRWAAGSDLGRGMGVATEGRLPAGRVADAAAWLLDPAGLWAGRDDHVVSFGLDLLGDRPPALLVWIPVALGVAVAVAARVVGRHDRRVILGVAGIAAAGVAATVTDLATARGAAVLWPFRWVAVVAMLVWVSLGWAVVAAVGAWARMRTERTGGMRARWRGPVRAVATAALVTLVAVPVAATVWRGSLGERPADTEAASDPFVRLVPAIVEHTRDEDLVVANSKVMINEVDMGLPVVLDRAGVPWVEADDPRAEGQPRFTVTRATALEGIVGWVVATGEAELLARSGPPQGDEGPDSELVLLRIDPNPAG